MARKPPPNQALFLIADLLFSSSMLITIFLLHFLAEPPVRGFFCDDDSIKYPYVKPILLENLAIFCLLVGPIVIFAIIELATSEGHQPLGKFKIPFGVLRLFEVTSTYLFGAGVSEVTVDSAKYMVGRLRPHFLDVCMPSPGCSDADIAANKYIDDYICTHDHTRTHEVNLVHEARLSFPSNFAAFAFYSAFYSVIYLQYNYKWNTAKTMRHLMQFALVMAAWFMSLSRFMDHSNHWEDIAVGIGIGTISAVLVAVFVSDLHRFSKVRLQQEKDDADEAAEIASLKIDEPVIVSD